MDFQISININIFFILFFLFRRGRGKVYYICPYIPYFLALFLSLHSYCDSLLSPLSSPFSFSLFQISVSLIFLSPEGQTLKTVCTHQVSFLSPITSFSLFLSFFPLSLSPSLSLKIWIWVLLLPFSLCLNINHLLCEFVSLRHYYKPDLFPNFGTLKWELGIFKPRSSFLCVLSGLWKNVEMTMMFGSWGFRFAAIRSSKFRFFKAEAVNLDLFGPDLILVLLILDVFVFVEFGILGCWYFIFSFLN